MDHMKQLKLDHLDFIPEEVSDFWNWQIRQMTQMRQRGMQAWHWKRQKGWRRGKLDQMNQLRRRQRKLDHLNQLEKEKENEEEEAASFKLLHN